MRQWLVLAIALVLSLTSCYFPDAGGGRVLDVDRWSGTWNYDPATSSLSLRIQPSYPMDLDQQLQGLKYRSASAELERDADGLSLAVWVAGGQDSEFFPFQYKWFTDSLPAEIPASLTLPPGQYQVSRRLKGYASRPPTPNPLVIATIDTSSASGAIAMDSPSR
jgi:hypothetical protein